MSYIDTFDHEFIGFIAGLPIYLPLETVTASDIPSEFGCSPQNLIIGGGDGEHPAIIVTDLLKAATHFVLVIVHESESEVALSDELTQFLDDAWVGSDFLLFPGWDIASYATFEQRCKSLACQTPYDQDRFKSSISIESWLVASIGEFVYFSMSNRCGALQAITPSIAPMLQRPTFLNVTIPAPGTPLIWGRKRDASENVQWGVSHWAEQQSEQLK